jgi:hypothetical protein
MTEAETKTINILLHMDDQMSKFLKAAGEQAKKTESSLKDLRETAKGLGGILGLSAGALGLKEITHLITEATLKFEHLKESASGALYLLTEQGRVAGISSWEDAAKAGEEMAHRARKMALSAGGLGDPGDLLVAARKLLPGEANAGLGSDEAMKDALRVQALAKIVDKAAPEVAEKLARLMSGAIARPGEELRLLGITLSKKEKEFLALNPEAAFTMIEAHLKELDPVVEAMSKGMEAADKKMRDEIDKTASELGEKLVPALQSAELALLHFAQKEVKGFTKDDFETEASFSERMFPNIVAAARTRGTLAGYASKPSDMTSAEWSRRQHLDRSGIMDMADMSKWIALFNPAKDVTGVKGAGIKKPEEGGGRGKDAESEFEKATKSLFEMGKIAHEFFPKMTKAGEAFQKATGMDRALYDHGKEFRDEFNKIDKSLRGAPALLDAWHTALKLGLDTVQDPAWKTLFEGFFVQLSGAAKKELTAATTTVHQTVHIDARHLNPNQVAGAINHFALNALSKRISARNPALASRMQ